MRTPVRTRPRLLTVDEARAALVDSAARCLSGATGTPTTLLAMLWGLDVGPGPTAQTRKLAAAHRATLDAVTKAGHGWIIVEELQGVIDATRVADGPPVNVDVIASQASPST